MAEGHGGRRTPANPAPVSNPQSGQRTDGGAGSKRQPLRVPAGGGYGERAAAEAQQQSAPLAVDAGNVPAPTGRPGGTGMGQPGGARPLPQLNAPTARPNEPVTAGAAPQATTDEFLDPDLTLRILYERTHNPYIARLIRERR